MEVKSITIEASCRV